MTITFHCRKRSGASWRFVPLYFQGERLAIPFPEWSSELLSAFEPLWTRSTTRYSAASAGWHILAIALHLCATSLAFFVARRLNRSPIGRRIRGIVVWDSSDTP